MPGLHVHLRRRCHGGAANCGGDEDRDGGMMNWGVATDRRAGPGRAGQAGISCPVVPGTVNGPGPFDVRNRTI